VNNNGNLVGIAIWGGIIVALFGYLWWKGYVARLTVYFQETWNELKPGRCSWPTWTELRGSTVLIGVTIFLLGAFVSVLDFVFNKFFTKVL
jgi:preprotein translocase SecE subunit